MGLHSWEPPPTAPSLCVDGAAKTGGGPQLGAPLLGPAGLGKPCGHTFFARAFVAAVSPHQHQPANRGPPSWGPPVGPSLRPRRRRAPRPRRRSPRAADGPRKLRSSHTQPLLLAEGLGERFFRRPAESQPAGPPGRQKHDGYIYIYIYIHVGYTQIAVVSYIRRLLVYKHTYPFAPEAASGTYSGRIYIKKHTYIYIYTHGYTQIAVVSYIRVLLVYIPWPRRLPPGRTVGRIYIYTPGYTLIAVVSYIRKLFVYIYTYICTRRVCQRQACQV